MNVKVGRVVARMLLVGAVFATTPVCVRAQVEGAEPAPPSSPAVYGGARRQQPGVNNLSLSANVLGGYDTNILADNAGLGGGTGGNLGSTDQTASTFAGTSAQLQWSQSRQRVSYFGSLGGQYRTFFDIDDFDAQSYDAGGGMSARLTNRSSLSLNGHVGVEPFYRWGVIGGGAGGGLALNPAEGQPFAPDFQAAREQVLRFSGAATYSYELGPRTSFSADVYRSGSRPINSDAEQAGLRNLGGTSANARIVYRLTTNLGARLGYGYTLYDRLTVDPVLPDPIDPVLPDAAPRSEQFGVHNIDVGVNYSRALTLARRTSFRFGTGTNITRQANSDQFSEGQAAQFNVSGFASLQREFLRTWAASLDYRRGTSYAEGYNEFVVYDTAAASIGGLFTDRLDASAGVSYTNGGFTSVRGGSVANIGGGAQLRYGITQNLAAFVSYTVTRFDIPEDRQPQGLVRSYRPDRQGVRVGLSLWVDLLR